METSNCSGSSSKHRGAFTYRKSNKILMEKRRRARINRCLVELKNLVLQAMRKDNPQLSKLEKADILELTVRYLRSIESQRLMTAMGTDPLVINKYRTGFGECAQEVIRYLASTQGVSEDMKTRLGQHLANYINVLDTSYQKTILSAPVNPASILHYQSTPLIFPSHRTAVSILPDVPSHSSLRTVFPGVYEHDSSSGTEVDSGHSVSEIENLRRLNDCIGSCSITNSDIFASIPMVERPDSLNSRVIFKRESPEPREPAVEADRGEEIWRPW